MSDDSGTAPALSAPVLVFAPGRDGELSCKVLEGSGFGCRLCVAEDAFFEHVPEAGVVLVAEEMLSESVLARLSDALSAQPAWSDLPILVVAHDATHQSRRNALAGMGNVSVLTRPMAVDTLTSAVAASLRARKRQFQVRDLLGEQREQARRKDEFLAMLAHELRNPLAPIRYAAQVLHARTLAPAQLRATAELVERQVGHMATIIDDLLDVSRVTRGFIKLQCAPFDVAALVRRTVEAHAIAAQAKGVDVHVGSIDEAWVNGDTTRLKQVLDNLLDNAVKFSPRGGEVVATLRREAEQVVLAVADRGPGLDAAVIPHIFEPFFQVDRSLDRSKGGLGLGLALVRGLVVLHGGEVQAESAGAGQGSTFVVRLPLCVVPAITPSPSDPVNDARPCRVLVAEDNRDSADALKLLLETQGHEVFVAYTGPDAVAVARDVAPDVVVCDIGLPGISGYDVANALRRDASFEHVRLIAVTGYGDAQDRLSALERGFDEHLRKPVEPGLLLAEIAKADVGTRLRQGRQSCELSRRGLPTQG
jgi:two-component system, sensor histidine kinase